MGLCCSFFCSAAKILLYLLIVAVVFFFGAGAVLLVQWSDTWPMIHSGPTSFLPIVVPLLLAKSAETVIHSSKARFLRRLVWEGEGCDEDSFLWWNRLRVAAKANTWVSWIESVISIVWQPVENTLVLAAFGASLTGIYQADYWIIREFSSEYRSPCYSSSLVEVLDPRFSDGTTQLELNVSAFEDCLNRPGLKDKERVLFVSLEWQFILVAVMLYVVQHFLWSGLFRVGEGRFRKCFVPETQQDFNLARARHILQANGLVDKRIGSTEPAVVLVLSACKESENRTSIGYLHRHLKLQVLHMDPDALQRQAIALPAELRVVCRQTRDRVFQRVVLSALSVFLFICGIMALANLTSECEAQSEVARSCSSEQCVHEITQLDGTLQSECIHWPLAVNNLTLLTRNSHDLYSKALYKYDINELCYGGRESQFDCLQRWSQTAVISHNTTVIAKSLSIFTLLRFPVVDIFASAALILLLEAAEWFFVQYLLLTILILLGVSVVTPNNINLDWYKRIKEIIRTSNLRNRWDRDMLLISALTCIIVPIAVDFVILSEIHAVFSPNTEEFPRPSETLQKEAKLSFSTGTIVCFAIAMMGTAVAILMGMLLEINVSVEEIEITLPLWHWRNSTLECVTRAVLKLHSPRQPNLFSMALEDERVVFGFFDTPIAGHEHKDKLDQVDKISMTAVSPQNVASPSESSAAHHVTSIELGEVQLGILSEISDAEELHAAGAEENGGTTLQ